MALSGGVDSAVSAYLLKKQGYEVRAVFMKNWTGTHLNLAGECNWTYERDDAAKVAKHLNIPFEVWDFEREYRRDVVDYFFREYARGRTPNPDVRCNQYVKIPLFLKRALKEGADFVATGHYCKKSKILNPKSEINPKSKIQNFNYNLLSAVDTNKDQSYFLYTLNQKQLKYLLFPVGEMTKPEVRALAKKIKLPVAVKPDSVGICFVGEVKMEDFLKTRLPNRPGKILDTKGNVLGDHQGLHFYTIGQRSGMGLANGPWYVIGRNRRRNELVVGKLKEQKYLLAKTFTTEKVHWVAGEAPKLPATFLVRHRYRHPVFSARVSKVGSKLKVVFQKSQRAITPGQSAVFYSLPFKHSPSEDWGNKKKGESRVALAKWDKKLDQNLICLGGAVIDKVENNKFKW